ncbi:hypothetical protein [Microbacterium sp.]|uniref:hypothetical protein n=1 Tax=Microbacterium sp. TaxID=51671 RepID=UPI003F7067BE
MPRNDDTPSLGGERREAEGDLAEAGSRRVIPDISGNPDAYARLIDIIGTMTSSGARADALYQRALKRASGDPEFVTLVAKTAGSLEEDAYEERWALTQLIVDLESPDAADALVELVRAPIPPEKAEDPSHGLSTVTEEVILRTTAIEGLARLQHRDVDTTDTLLETISASDYVSLRRASWFALVDGGRDDAIEKARSILGDRGDSWITELKRIPVEEAPQADRAQIGRAKPRPRRPLPEPFDG